jgi:hypothetical protein
MFLVPFSFPRFILTSLLAWALVSCSSTSVFQLSADEQSLLQSAMNTPLTFVVPRDQAIASWDRASDFVQRYSTMKLRSVTDSLITVYDEPSVTPLIENASSIRFGYSVRRSRDPGGILYQVQCTASSKTGDTDAAQNAHIAAYYVKTGLVCDRCIVR